MTYQVSFLEQEDMKWFVEIAAVNMLKEELQRPELVNVPHLYALAEQGLKDSTAFVVKDGYEYVGALGALLLPNLYNPTIKTMAEVFWYVLPDYRETRAGYLLLKEYDRRSREVADEATLSLLGTSKVNMKSLEKRGFMLGEFAFRKEY